MTRALRIINPGASSTVQDWGRIGQAHLGVPASGAMDLYAHNVANWLVGNRAKLATLEMTMLGAEVEVLSETNIAVTGADMQLTINGKTARQWMSHRLLPGDRIKLGFAVNGCRSYLALTGGIDVPLILGSRSTCLGAKFGGYQGRTLQVDDIRASGQANTKGLHGSRMLPWIPRYSNTLVLLALAGPHDDWFSEYGQAFFSTTYTVSSQSNRMGCRLQGEAVKKDNKAPKDMLSVPMAPGNIQIPPSGQPIVLFREQTSGGYPCIATVLTSELWRLAQLQPGGTIRFEQALLDKAHQLHDDWLKFFREIRTQLSDNKKMQCELARGVVLQDLI